MRRNAAMRYRALSDIRVLDLTHYIAGPYATRLLADMGAHVIKVEPPHGEGGRRMGSNRVAGNRTGGEALDRGPLFAYLNLNKLGVTLNLKHPRGRELLTRLTAESDLLVENFAPGGLAALGLEPQALLEQSPRLSIVSISNFGQDGPDRDTRLNDLVLFARGGWTYPAGEPDREPITPPGSLGQYIGGLFAAIGAMQALFARDDSGRGQHVDVSLLEAVAATMIYDTVIFQYTGTPRKREGRMFARISSLIATLKCRDGYAGLHCVSERQFEGLYNLMGTPELAHDSRFATPLQRMAHIDELLAIAETFFIKHDAAFLYREGQKRGVPIVPIPTLAQVLEWEQLKARRYFETIDDPVLGKIRVPGNPFRLGSHTPEASRPAPRLGEHNREVLGRLGITQAELENLRTTGVV
jgi:crotonobetainyl-CoA:carnitine CoA-transferase CaiB-like acyl-CoA transferase